MGEWLISVLHFGKKELGMQKRITFSGRPHSPVLDEQIDKQLEKIVRFLEGEPSPMLIEIHIAFHEIHQFQHVTGRVKTAHYDCFAKHEGPDVFTEVNEVVDRLYAQLRDAKERAIDRHKKGCDKECRAQLAEEFERKNFGEDTGDDEA